MHHRIIPLLFLMNGYLIGMGPGVWDNHGNYLGPTPSQAFNPVFVPVPMMHLVPVYVPVPDNLIRSYPFNYMPHLMQPPMVQLPAREGQWAARAPVGELPPQPSVVHPQLDIAHSSLQDPLPKTSTWRIVGETPHSDEHALSEKDDEVASITAGLQKVTVTAHNLEEKPKNDVSQSTSSTVGTVSAASSGTCSMSWADVEDDDNDAPATLPAGWQKRVALTEQNTSPANVAQLPAPAEIKKTEGPSVFTSASWEVQTNTRAQSLNNQSGVHNAARPQPQSNAQEMPLDERLHNAMRNSQNMHAVLNLMRKKISWLTENCPSRRCTGECAQLVARLQENLGNSCPVGQHASSLLDDADQCIRRTIQEKDEAIKGGFADLAKQLIAIAQNGSLSTDQKKRIKNQLHRMPNTKIVDNQADGRVFHAEVGNTQEDKKKPVVPVVAPKKKKTQKENPVVPEAAVMQNKTADTPHVVVQAPKHIEPASAAPDAPKERVPAVITASVAKKLDGQIRAILKERLSKQSVAFLQNAVEQDGEIEDACLKKEALLELGIYYAEEAQRDPHPTKESATQSSRAKSYMRRALEGGHKEALPYLIMLAYHENDMPELKVLCDRVCGDDAMNARSKDFACAHRAMMQLREDPENQWAGQALKAFKEIERHHAWNDSMTDFANALPESFYIQMRELLSERQSKIIKSTGAQQGEHDTNTNVLRDDATLEWLYLMGRMHLEGTESKVAQHQYAAIEWLKTAADSGHLTACIYLASCREVSSIPVGQRIDYLAYAMQGDPATVSQADRVQTAGLCELYAMEGHLTPLAHSLAVYYEWQCKDASSQNKFDEFLGRLRAKFPQIKIGGRLELPMIKTMYGRAESVGLLDELNKRAQEDWVSRALICALEIANADDSKAKIPSFLVLVRNAIRRIEPDMESHPEIKQIIAAGYARLGLGSELLGERGLAEEWFKKGMDMGDNEAKLGYAHLNLYSVQVVQSSKAPTQAQLKAIGILEKLAEQNPEYKSRAFRELAEYYAARQEWGKALEYIECAKQWIHFIHSSSKEIEELEAFIKAERAKQHKDNRTKLQQRIKHAKERGASSESGQRAAVSAASTSSSSVSSVSSSASSKPIISRDVLGENRERINALQNAHKDILEAMENAHDRPFVALGFLRSARDQGIVEILPENPELTLWYAMAVVDVRGKILDGSLSDLRLVEAGLKGIEENITYVDTALKHYFDEIKNGLDVKLIPQGRKCLTLYWMIRWMWVIKDKPVPEQVDGVHKILAVLPAGDRILLEDIQPECIYTIALQAIETSLENARAAYMQAVGEKPIMLYMPI